MYKAYRAKAKELLDKIHKKKQDLGKPREQPVALEKEFTHVVSVRKYNESSATLLRALLRIS